MCAWGVQCSSTVVTTDTPLMTWNRRAGARTEICIGCNERSPAAGKRRCKECLADMEHARRERIKDEGDGRPCATDGCEKPRYRLKSQYSSYCYEHHLLVRHKSRLMYSYGLSLEEYEALMARTDGCQLCGSKVRLVVDHCHDTGVVRGVLCDPHNVMLGWAKDDPEILMAAARYLLSFQDVLGGGPVVPQLVAPIRTPRRRRRRQPA